MTAIESAWPKHPDYRIDLVPVTNTARVWHGDLLLAESDRCLLVKETRHVDRLYVPEGDVRWELFSVADEAHSVCPFKGQADYWDLTAVEPVESKIVWAYRTPFDEVAEIAGHVCFYQERTRIELDEPWPDDPPGHRRVRRFPLWGDAADLVHLLDVAPSGDGRFEAPAHGDSARNVVEGGQLLGEAIVAASKTVPDQRVTSASMIFAKPVAFDAPQDLRAEVLRGGRSFSTVEVRVEQGGSFRGVAIALLGAEVGDTIRHAVPLPEVPGPEDAPFFDGWGVTGRELRIVDGAYDRDPDRTGPPELFVWCRFRDDPGSPALRAALVAQSTTHWTIAAAMRPHPGFGEARAHDDLSTGVLACSVAFHDHADVRDWLLYATRATYAGHGLAHGEGRVHARDGGLVASYSCQVMIRAFDRTPAELGMDRRTVM
jgi:acyl-CoA thioesterase-2